MLAYAASKGGMEMMTRTLAEEWADPLGRFATTAEIAACAMFLASPISGYVPGATLFADGGWSVR